MGRQGHPRKRGRDSLTEELVSRVEQLAGGDQRAADWFFRYIETNDATGAVKEAGFPTKWPATRANRLIKRFAPLIHEASILKRATIESLALDWHEKVLRTDHMVPVLRRRSLPEGGSVEEPVYETGEDGKPKMLMVADPRLMTVKNRSADSILDRGWQPKGLALHGMSPMPAGEGPSRDFRILLDRLVEDFMPEGGTLSQGAAVVLALPTVIGHKEYRDYLEQQYPQPKQIEPIAEPQSELPS